MSTIDGWRDVTTKHVKTPFVRDEGERQERNLHQRHLHQITYVLLCNPRSQYR